MIEYVLRQPGEVAAVDKELPELQPEEVLIKVKYVGICGSDIHLYHGTYQGPHSYPMLFGHEWAGEVTAAGDNVSSVNAGDWVTGDCSKYCGSCKNCEKDKNLCLYIEKFGITIDGASAEYIVRDQKYLYKGGPDIPEKLLCLSEPIAVAAHLISKVRNVCKEGLREKQVLIFGGGVIGMSAMMLLKHMYDCEYVALYDLSEHRTGIAGTSGADIPDAESLKAAGDGGNYAALYESARYDIILETTGVPAVFSNAFSLLKPAGILGCVGMAASVEIPQKQIVTKSLTVVGSIGGSGDFRTAMEFIKKYPEEAEKLISHYYPMSDFKEAFSMAGEIEKSMKVVLTL